MPRWLRRALLAGNGGFDQLRSRRTFGCIYPASASVELTVERRADRTRAAILQAFANLLFRVGFENVSVQGIVAEADIARSTFYEHFSSKEDVLRASMAQFLAVLAPCVSSDDQPSGLTNVLDHFWDNRRLTDAIFSGAARQVIALSLSELIETQLRESAGGELLLPNRLAAIHIAEAQLALIESWLRGRAFARVDDVAAALHRTSRASATAISRGFAPGKA